ncbi:MAG: hemerythrin domain-containing protein [Pseudomonadota bacterium]
METITAYLEGDHARCHALFETARKRVAALEWGSAADDFAAFAYAMERHLIMEERIVFPAYEKAVRTTTGPTSIMRSEHLHIRAIVQRMADSIAAGHAKEFGKHADTLRIVVLHHGEKEEGVLYPMIDRILGGRQGEVIAAMRAFGALDVMAEAQ